MIRIRNLHPTHLVITEPSNRLSLHLSPNEERRIVMATPAIKDAAAMGLVLLSENVTAEVKRGPVERKPVHHRGKGVERAEPKQRRGRKKKNRG